jgi:hypothetical protein
MVSPPTEVRLSSLRLGEKLGSGGQGDVYLLRQWQGHNQAGTAFKRYRDKNANARALLALVDFPGMLAPDAFTSLRSQTAWPLSCVTDGKRVAGFLMRTVPGRFIGRVSNGTPRLRELQYLLYPPKPLWGDITPLDATGRIVVAEAFVRLVRLLHEHSIVLGDISMRNILWCAGKPSTPGKAAELPRIFVIDCDSARRIGFPPVLPQPQTVDWDDPQMPASGPDLDTDRYKVALVVGRVLAARHDIRPGDAWRPVDGVPWRIAEAVRECFNEAAKPRNFRPDVGWWVQALNGRETMRLRPPRRPSAPVRRQNRAPGEDRGKPWWHWWLALRSLGQ